jgi:hypothetical protein
MTIANESASSAAANRITTCTGANITTTGQGVVTLIYSSSSVGVSQSRWIVTSYNT